MCFEFALKTAHVVRLNKADVLALSKADLLPLNNKACLYLFDDRPYSGQAISIDATSKVRPVASDVDYGCAPQLSAQGHVREIMTSGSTSGPSYCKMVMSWALRHPRKQI